MEYFRRIGGKLKLKLVHKIVKIIIYLDTLESHLISTFVLH